MAGKALHRRFIDGECVWEYFENGEWVEIWWGLLAPSAADIEDLIPVELIEFHKSTGSNGKSISLKSVREDTAGPSAPVVLRMQRELGKARCLGVTTDLGESDEESLGYRRYYVKHNADIEEACKVIAECIELDLGEPVQWQLLNNQYSETKTPKQQARESYIQEHRIGNSRIYDWTTSNAAEEISKPYDKAKSPKSVLPMLFVLALALSTCLICCMCNAAKSSSFRDSRIARMRHACQHLATIAHGLEGADGGLYAH